MRDLKAIRDLASTRPTFAHMCFGLHDADGGECHSIEILPGENDYTHRERMKWADAHHADHGCFPDCEAQIQFMIDAKERYRTELWPIVQRRAAMTIAHGDVVRGQEGAADAR